MPTPPVTGPTIPQNPLGVQPGKVIPMPRPALVLPPPGTIAAMAVAKMRSAHGAEEKPSVLSGRESEVSDEVKKLLDEAGSSEAKLDRNDLGNAPELGSDNALEPVPGSPTTLQKMSHRHMAVVELALCGKSIKDIAEIADYTPAGVRMILAQPLVQDYMAKQRTSRSKDRDEAIGLTTVRAKELIASAALQAAQTQIDLLGSKDEGIRLKSSMEIIKNCYGAKGMTPDTESQKGGSKITMEMDGESMARFLQALKGSGLEIPDIQDADFTEAETTEDEATNMEPSSGGEII